MTFSLVKHRIAARSAKNYCCPSFTLAELLVTVAVIGILSGIGIAISTFELRRANLNSVQLAVAGWLQTVQRAALENKSEDITTGGCEVTFQTLTNQGPGAEIATVTPAACSPEPSLRLPGYGPSNATFSSSPTQATLIFTPRGTTIFPGSADTNPQFQYRIVRGGTSPVGCVRVAGSAGIIAIGSNSSSASVSDNCANFNAF